MLRKIGVRIEHWKVHIWKWTFCVLMKIFIPLLYCIHCAFYGNTEQEKNDLRILIKIFFFECMEMEWIHNESTWIWAWLYRFLWTGKIANVFAVMFAALCVRMILPKFAQHYNNNDHRRKCTEKLGMFIAEANRCCSADTSAVSPSSPRWKNFEL